MTGPVPIDRPLSDGSSPDSGSSGCSGVGDALSGDALSVGDLSGALIGLGGLVGGSGGESSCGFGNSSCGFGAGGTGGGGSSAGLLLAAVLLGT
eukprot:10481553-Karenia_brevis.AAC.1